MSERIAVDIVLIPDEPIYSAAHALIEKEIDGDLSTYIPHITLYPVSILREDLGLLQQMIQEVVAGIKACDIDFYKSYLFETSSGFAVTRTQALDTLHADVIQKVRSLDIALPATGEGFYLDPGQEPWPGTVNWMNEFLDRLAFENNFPHLTIGHKIIDPEVMLPSGKAASVALTHVGNHGRSRSILHNIALS